MESLNEEEMISKINKEFDTSVIIARALKEARSEDQEVEVIRQFLLELKVPFENVDEALYNAMVANLR
jgi:hypothetical protein